jgi:cytochrome c
MKNVIRAFAMGFVAGTLGFLALEPGKAATAGNAGRGGTLYQDKCTGCHSIDANRVGPAHRGVYGRKAGLAPGFAYSPGLKNSKIIWNDATLDRWLTNPQATISGARMGFRLGDPAQRGDIIAFLKTQGAKKKR